MECESSGGVDARQRNGGVGIGVGGDTGNRFAIDSLHLTYGSYAVDIEIARRIQVQMDDNKLFDVGMRNRIKKTLAGVEDDDASNTAARKDKKENEHKKQKKGKQDSASEAEDNDAEQTSSDRTKSSSDS